ncbi:ubiquitin carboxyl-terminal hydrolase isozyme L3-like protein [Euroglyphus maynei]|uniref:Ubiquitin carboxyl-terminal hydrolase n=1 Tax=Euroglyphus maynei TaxID=6958 RepID=A0A1Y3ARD1_EURMA|nr:ubiquitin carboxyl-terminal hydrolase isozyme L3-like protein [Euroglyphus maynei]
MSTDKEEYWLPLESDPTNLSDYLRSLTTGSSNGRYLIDIPSIDLVDEMGIFEFHDALAYIFLYPTKSYRRLGEFEPLDNNDRIRNIFFMRQYVHNSCGSVALFHAYINTIATDKLTGADSLIDRFFQENRDRTAEERGQSFATNSLLRQLHHDASMRGQSQLPSQEQLSKIDYHYVAFVPHNGHIFELDGRQSSPIIHTGQVVIDKDNFKREALNIIKQYMQLDPDSLEYSLLALCASS